MLVVRLKSQLEELDHVVQMNASYGIRQRNTLPFPFTNNRQWELYYRRYVCVVTSSSKNKNETVVLRKLTYEEASNALEAVRVAQAKNLSKAPIQKFGEAHYSVYTGDDGLYFHRGDDVTGDTVLIVPYSWLKEGMRSRGEL